MAFLPDFLAPTADLSSKALRVALSDADRALAQLEGTVRQIERPEMLFRNYLRREALLSSKIEGIRSTLADLVLFEAAKRGQNRGTQEVVHYVEASNMVVSVATSGLSIGISYKNCTRY